MVLLTAHDIAFHCGSTVKQWVESSPVWHWHCHNKPNDDWILQTPLLNNPKIMFINHHKNKDISLLKHNLNTDII